MILGVNESQNFFWHSYDHSADRSALTTKGHLLSPYLFCNKAPLPYDINCKRFVRYFTNNNPMYKLQIFYNHLTIKIVGEVK